VIDRPLSNQPVVALSADPSNTQRNRPIAQRNWPIVQIGRQHTTDAPSTNAFKNRLDKLWKEDMGI